jgi:hypothetical protein
VSSAPIGRWRAFVDYAGIAAEVFAAIVVGLMLIGLILMA